MEALPTLKAMSTMHEHDHDLIATVAEGLLAAELGAAAEAEISWSSQSEAVGSAGLRNQAIRPFSPQAVATMSR